MTYVPFARKYRPQTLEDLVGQSHVTATLARALETKRMAQAYLFTGQRGVGKTSAARLLAKCLNCEQGPTPTPCNRCTSCTQIAHGTSLDVIEIDGASNRGIEEIRTLRQTVPFAPTTGTFRLYIIDEVHMLTTEAFNALLKTLEEPPAHVKFIFATTAAGKVPSTILSRCQRFDFRRIDTPTIVGVLARVAKAEGLSLEEPALYAIARAAEGSLRDAEVILEQAVSFVEGRVREVDVTELLGSVEFDAMVAWTQALLDRDTPETLAALTRELDRGKDVVQLLAGLLRHLRNLLMVSCTREAPSRGMLLTRLVDEPPDRLKRLEEQAGRVSPQELLVFLQILTGAYELVRRSPMAQTVLELVLIKLATREAWQSLEEISRRLEQLGGSAVAVPRQTPQPVPARETPTQPAASAPDALVAQWPVFLERLGTQKMSLAAYLANSRPLVLSGGTLTIGLPGFILHHEVLSTLEHRRLIERLLSEVCEVRVRVEYATLPEPTDASASDSGTPAAEPAAPPIVQDIVNLFNATVMNRPPRPTP